MKRIDMKDIIQRIEQLVGIDEEADDFYEGKEERFFFLTGENQSGVEEKYIIYDCHEKDYQFNLESYIRIMEEEEDVATPIIIFKDWEHERKLFWSVYDVASGAKEKRALNDYFTKKISVYTDLGEYVALQVEEDGINYLEYIPEGVEIDESKGLKGYIYNISLFELKKLFNITGTSLFKMNVRNGLRKNATGRELRKKFRNYLCVGLYNQFYEMGLSSDDAYKLKEVLEINDDEVLKNSVPQNFWFYHNGITIFSYDTPIDRRGSSIKINPMNVSVINGAQTLTNFFAEWDELRHDLPEKLEEVGKVTLRDIEQKFDEVCKSIKIKSILIDGKLDNIRPITNGLNTQIPIFHEDIIAGQDNVKEINKHIMKRGMKILKSGEDTYNGEGMSVVDFVKRFLLIENAPGKSKNLKKTEIEGLLEEALGKFKKSDEAESTLLKQFEILVELEEWWKNSKKERVETYVDRAEIVINNYGKNYFFSYVLNESTDDLAPEYTFVLFDRFIMTFKNLDSNLGLEKFKTDALFEKYLINKEQEEEESADILSQDETCGSELNAEDVDAIIDYLRENEVSNYAYAKAMADYIKALGKEISYFRVIKRYENASCFFPKEAFPFPSSTFSELYRNIGVEEGDPESEYLPYEESNFHREICRHYPVFVIDFVKDTSKHVNEIDNVEYIKSFSFEKFNNEAKAVYEQTVEAFKTGDESMFPKMGDGLGFHVRPKAINADDTFEFTNGAQITKRSFWANRETVNILIEELKEK